MRVRITRQPTGSIDGVNVSLFKPDNVYDLPPALATYLMVEGWAEVEMRRRVANARDRRKLPALREIRDLIRSVFPGDEAS